MIDESLVLHIANLAKLEIDEKEKVKYQQQLSDIMQDIEKIVSVDIPNHDIMISPTVNHDCLDEDKIGYHLSKDYIFRNAKAVLGDYIAVEKVIE